jgi:hypothetical protein
VQSKNPFINDVSKLLNGAFGIAQNARTEMETAVSSILERWISERNLVNREEFDAIRLMVEKTAERNHELEKKLLKLEAELRNLGTNTPKKPRVKKP